MTDAQVNGQPSQAVHIVDTATGADRVLVDGSDFDMPVWRQDGIYVVHHAVGTDESHGLVRLDPTTGAQTVIPVPNVYLSRGWDVRGPAAWATGFEQGEKPSDGFATDLLESYDLATGAITTWWHDSAHPVVFLGSTPEGLPVVQVRTFSGSGTNVSISHDEAAVLASLNTVRRVLVQADHQLNFDEISVDDHGLWLVGLQGVFLAPPGEPATQVSAYQRAMGFAGPCD